MSAHRKIRTLSLPDSGSDHFCSVQFESELLSKFDQESGKRPFNVTELYRFSHTTNFLINKLLFQAC